MVCGLFSSFDPGMFFNYSEFFHLKWVMLLLVFAFCDFRLFSLPLGMSLVSISVIKFVTSMTFEISKKPKEMILMLSSLMFLVLMVNLLGMMPFSFSVTSHLSINLSWSIPLWMSGLLVTLFSSVKSFLAHMTPFGAPMFLLPLLVLVETVSYFIRPLTLGIRLMANVMAGHLILSLMGSTITYSLTMLPSVLLLGGFLAFEICVCVVQAYVFFMLTAMYWKESEV
nr:ATP synthase F0 subunit 6 [Strongylocotes lipogonus]